MWAALCALDQDTLTKEIVELYIVDYGLVDLLYQLGKVDPDINTRNLILDTIIERIVNEWESIDSDGLRPDTQSVRHLRGYIRKFHGLGITEVFDEFHKSEQDENHKPNT
jgi:hypothetical protein